MVDFINEVEEELRKDDYNALLKKYGPIIAGIIILIIAVTGFIEWRKSADSRAARATSASYVQALDTARSGEKALAVEQFEALAAVSPEGYKGLSLMQAGTLKLELGEHKAAIDFYDAAAQSLTQPRHSHLAQLKSAYILASLGAYEDVQSRLDPLIAKDAPYEFLARELLGFSAMELGDEKSAREQFGYLEAIPGVPPTIKERAEQSLTLIRAKSALNPPDPVDAVSVELEQGSVEQDPVEQDPADILGVPELSEPLIADNNQDSLSSPIIWEAFAMKFAVSYALSVAALCLNF